MQGGRRRHASLLPPGGQRETLRTRVYRGCSAGTLRVLLTVGHMGRGLGTPKDAEASRLNYLYYAGLISEF